MLNSLLGTLSSGVAASTSSYESIATATGTGSNTTITFSSIPSTYKHLQIRYIAQRTTGAGNQTLRVTFNSDSTTTYDYHRLQGDGAAASAAGTATAAFGLIVPGAGNNSTNITGVGIIDIHDYASTTKNKTTRYFSGYDSNNTEGGIASLGSFLWRSTSAITQIDVKFSADNFATSSTFALYGIKGA